MPDFETIQELALATGVSTATIRGAIAGEQECEQLLRSRIANQIGDVNNPKIQAMFSYELFREVYHVD